MRVLLVSDLHFDLRKLDWVLAQSAGHDAVVIAGDLLDIASSVPLDAQITVALTYLDRLGARVPTIVCSGNHDLDHRNDAGEKATRWLAEATGPGVHGDGDSVDIDGWRMTACAWWEGPSTLGQLESQLAGADASRQGRWLWAFHGPPEGPLSWTGSRHYGDPELPRLLDTYRPDLVLCGHIHEAPFTDEGTWVERRGGTWLFNAGFQRGEVPAFVEIDLAAETASWRSHARVDQVDLAGPSSVAPAEPLG